MSKSIITGTQKTTYTLLGILILLSTAMALYAEEMVLAVIPAVFLVGLAIIRDFRLLYYGFFLLLPFSVEVELGSLGTDLPSEPMMLGLTGIAIVLFFQNIRNIPKKLIYHPITALLLLHLGWILVTAIFAVYPVLSIKFLLAKTWYVIPFYFLGFYMLRDKADFILLFKCAVWTLIPTVAFILGRHYLEDFTFDTSNEVVYPIFRNHVSYAAMIVTLLPYLWVLWKEEGKVYQAVGLVLLIVGTYFSYTRAAHLCIVIMIGCYFIYKYQVSKYFIVVSLIGALLFTGYMVHENKYLDYAPDFSRTISHDKFDNLLEATYKMEDISTMERVYRWVAGGYMIGEKPIMGYGPSNFYRNYTTFTVRSFETYVSDNPEKSGIHCYYLMTWVEQGIVGLIIFLALCILMLRIGERVYDRLSDITDKRIVMAALLSTTSILALCIINDLIETDKVGVFFFVNAFIIARYSLKVESKDVLERA